MTLERTSIATAALLCISLIVTSAFPLPAAAESFHAAHSDFFNLLSPRDSDVEAAYLYQPGTEEDGGPGEFDLNLLSFAAEFIRPDGRDSYLRWGAEYEARLYDFDGAGVDSETFHKAVLRFGGGHFVSDRLLFTGVLRPALLSDLGGSFDEDDVQLLGDGMMAYRFNPGTQFVLGVSYGETFDDTPLLPFAGVRLLSEDGRFHIKVTVPVEAEVVYRLEPRLMFYGGYWISGDEYHIDNNGESFDVQVHDRRLGAGVQYWLTGSFSMRAEAGMIPGSELEFKRADSAFRGDLDSGPYLTFGLGLSL